MNIWDRMIASLNWSLIDAQGLIVGIPLELLSSVPIIWDWPDTIGLSKFNLN